MKLGYSKVWYILIFISLFLFIYAPRLVFGITINLSIVVFLLYVIIFFKYFLRSLYIQPTFLMFWFFLAIYNLIVAYSYGHDYSFFSKIATSVPLYLIFGSIFYYVVKKYNFFSGNTPLIFLLKNILFVILINSLIILGEFAIPDFKTLIESVLFNDFSNVDIIHYADHPFVLRGFSSAAGAGQSLFSSIGVLIVFYFYFKRLFTLSKTIVYFVLLFSAQIFLGRIGLIFSLGFLGIFFIKIIFDFILKNAIFKVRIFLQLLAVFILFKLTISVIDFDADVLKWSFDWIDLNEGIVENSSSKEISDNYFFLPSNPIHLIFGVGFFDGSSNIYNRSDVGYVKTIFSCGVIFGVMLYSLVFFKLYKFSFKFKGSGMFFCSLIITLLLAEFKEPFIYQNFVGRAVFLMLGFLGTLIFEDNAVYNKLKNNKVTINA